MRTRQSGLTLVEAMVVIAIVAIIAAIAAPSYLGMRDSQRVRAAAEAVYSHVQFARSESVKQDRNLWVRTTAGANWCVGISNATGCDCSAAASCRFGPATNLVEHNLVSTDFSGITLGTTAANLEFDSRRGTVAGGGNATITITGANGLQGQVRIAPLGGVSLCGNMGRYPAC